MTLNNRKIKVAIDTRGLELASSGIKTVYEGLIAQFNIDRRFELICLRPVNVKVPRTNLEKILEHVKFIYWKEFRLPRLVRAHHCDILICNDYIVPIDNKGFDSFPIFHGTNFWELSDHYNSIWLKYFTWIALRGAKKSKYILTVSNFSKNRLTKVLKLNPQQIRIIPLGMKPLPAISDEMLNSISLSKFGIDPNDKYLLHVGVLEKRKNLPRLLEAIELLNNSEYKMVLVGGKGPKASLDDSENIGRLIKEKGLMDQVILTGYVSNEELALLYRKAELYVFPSYYEGFGIPVLEAYQYKIPLVSSNSGALKEIVGNKGIFFNPEDPLDIKEKIDFVLKNDKVKDQLIRNGENRLNIYNWKNTINSLKDIFQA